MQCIRRITARTQQTLSSQETLTMMNVWVNRANGSCFYRKGEFRFARSSVGLTRRGTWWNVELYCSQPVSHLVAQGAHLQELVETPAAQSSERGLQNWKDCVFASQQPSANAAARNHTSHQLAAAVISLQTSLREKAPGGMHAYSVLQDRSLQQTF